MALVDCKVCGSQTSSEDETCMICGYPWRGRPKSRWLKWTAIALAAVFALFLLLDLL